MKNRLIETDPPRRETIIGRVMDGKDYDKDFTFEFNGVDRDWETNI